MALEMESDEKICTFCSDVILGKWFDPLQSSDCDDPRRNHEWTENLTDSASCRCCAFLLAAPCDDPEYNEVSTPSAVKITIFRAEIMGSLSFPGSDQSNERVRRVEYVCGDKNGSLRRNAVNLFGGDAIDDLMALGRARTVNRLWIDLNLMNEWMGLCRQQHGTACERFEDETISKLTLRLVDVELRCVVEAPRGSRYFALS